jgi:lipopolysaccharide export LptBFGC system permease protein LptF
VRVNVSAAAGAAVATVLAAVGDAKHPAQVVVTIAAACAFGAVLTRGRQAVPADWFTVQVLLAGNLVVFGISNAHQLGVGLTASVVLAGVLLLVAAIWIYRRSPRERGRDR